MPARRRELFSELALNGDGSPDPIGMIAFAQLNADLYETLSHIERQEDRTTDHQDVEDWLSKLPDSRLADYNERAKAWLDAYAWKLMAPEIARREEAARNSAIVQQIERATAWPKSLVQNVVGGFIATGIFFMLLVALYLTGLIDPSPADVASSVNGG